MQILYKSGVGGKTCIALLSVARRNIKLWPELVLGLILQSSGAYSVAIWWRESRTIVAKIAFLHPETL